MFFKMRMRAHKAAIHAASTVFVVSIDGDIFTFVSIGSVSVFTWID
jgi:hypothetical protein